MSKSHLSVLAGLSALWLLWTVTGTSLEQAQGEGEGDKAAPPKASSLLAGTASCSARGCHGGLAPSTEPTPHVAVLQDEYGRWLPSDPHTKAYAVLFNDESKRISKLLYA